MENTSFSGFGTSPHYQDHPPVVGGILDSGGLAAIFARLEPAGLLYLVHSAGESSSDALCHSGHPPPIHCHGMGLASGGIHPQDLPLIPPLPVSCH